MNPPEGLSDRARQRAEQLFEARRLRGGIRTRQPERYTQCEADAPEPIPGGWQVRVRTWRHWSHATVQFDADTGIVMYQCIDRLSDPPADAQLTQDEAVRLAGELVEIPADAEFASFRHEPFADGGRNVARLEWRHVHRGLRVDGDFLWIMIHPTTHRLVAFARKWRQI